MKPLFKMFKIVLIYFILTIVLVIEKVVKLIELIWLIIWYFDFKKEWINNFKIINIGIDDSDVKLNYKTTKKYYRCAWSDYSNIIKYKN